MSFSSKIARSILLSFLSYNTDVRGSTLLGVVVPDVRGLHAELEAQGISFGLTSTQVLKIIDEKGLA